MALYESTQWAANQVARPSLTIGGEDYTSQLLAWNVSDASAYKNGLITTTGTLSLASLGNLTGLQIEDYQKRLFKRGTEVVLDLVVWDPSVSSQIVVRHPRGLLYVMGTSYSLTSQQLEINLGCKISLYMLDDEANYSYLAQYAQLPLQPDQQTISNIGATLAARGMALYQTNYGDLNAFQYFSPPPSPSNSWDEYTGGGGEWVSINGVTAFAANPLRGAAPLPDDIKLSYNHAISDEESSNPSAPQRTKSHYYIEYPAIVYEKIQTTGSFDPIIGTADIPLTIDVGDPGGTGDTGGNGSASGGCGNSPNPTTTIVSSGGTFSSSGTGIEGLIIKPGWHGGDSGEEGIATPYSCSDHYSTTATTKTKSVYSHEMSYSKFNGYGGQVSYKYQERKGPAVELNNQYYADSLAYCYSRFATVCNPSGLCGTPGTNSVKQSYQETFYEYGSTGLDEGVLKAEETHVWENTLSAAKPSDWRSGIKNGSPQSFTHLSEQTLYRSTVRRVEYSREGKWNKTVEKIWTSQASTGNGLSGAL